MCDLCARNSSYVRVSKRAVRCHRWRRSNARMRQRHEIDNNVDHRTDNNIASDHTQTLSAVFCSGLSSLRLTEIMSSFGGVYENM